MDFDAAQGFDTGGAPAPAAPAPDTQPGDVSAFMDPPKAATYDAANPRGSLMAVAMDQLRQQGVPEANLRAAAAHLVGQADSESQFNANAVHDQGTGYGLYGARLNRRDSMLSWMKDNGFRPNDPEGQMRYMATEAMSGKYPQTRNILLNANPDDLARHSYHVTGEFEAPAVINNRAPAVIRAYMAGGDTNGATPQIAPSNSIDQFTQALVQGGKPKGRGMDQTNPYGNGPVPGGQASTIPGLTPPPDNREFAQALINNALGKNDAPGRGTTIGKLAMLFGGMNEQDKYNTGNQQYLKALGTALATNGNDPSKVAQIAAMSGNPELIKQAFAAYGTQPQWGVIGKDMFGNDQHGWINPRTQSVTPGTIGAAPQLTQQAPAGPSTPGAPAGAPGAPGVPGAAPAGGAPGAPALPNGTVQSLQNPQQVQALLNSDIKGDELLKHLDPTTRDQVSAMLEGREGVGNAARGTPRWQMLVALAHKADPTFDDSVFAARAAMRKNAMAGGTDYKTIQSANSVFHHLDQLSDAADKVDNFSSVGPAGLGTKAANEVRTWGREQQGDPAITNFNYMRDLALKEVEKFYTANGGTEGERKQAAVAINAASTPQQLHEAIAQLGHAMTGKINEIDRQWKQTMGPKIPNLNVVAPASQDTIKKLDDRAARYQKKPEDGKADKPDAKPADAPKTVSSKAEYDALPSGAEYIDARNGNHMKKK